MNLEILTPDAKVYEGEVLRVVFPGAAGKFEILQGHAPLIAALNEGTIKVTSANDVQEIKVKSGFVEVLNNQLSVLVEGTLG